MLVQILSDGTKHQFGATRKSILNPPSSPGCCVAHFGGAPSPSPRLCASAVHVGFRPILPPFQPPRNRPRRAFFGIDIPQQKPGSSSLVNPNFFWGPPTGRHICPSFFRTSIYALHRLMVRFNRLSCRFQNSVPHPRPKTSGISGLSIGKMGLL